MNPPFYFGPAYKYCAAATLPLIVAKQKMWFSRADTFNDAFELSPFLIPLDWEDIVRISKTDFEAARSVADIAFTRVCSSLYITCFSKQGITNLVLILTGAAITLIAHDGVEPNDRWLSAFIVFLGLFGAAFSYKCYERFRCHTTRAAEAISRLENANTGLDLASIIPKADSEHRKKHKILPGVRLYWYWFAMHVFVITIGGVLHWQTLAK